MGANSSSPGQCGACPDTTYQDKELHADTACADQPVCGRDHRYTQGTDADTGNYTTEERATCEPCEAGTYQDKGSHREPACVATTSATTTQTTTPTTSATATATTSMVTTPTSTATTTPTSTTSSTTTTTPPPKQAAAGAPKDSITGEWHMYAGVAGGILLVLLVGGVVWHVSRSKSVRTQGTALGGWNTVANPTYGVHQAPAGRVVSNAVYGTTPGQANQPLYADAPVPSGRRVIGNSVYGSAQGMGQPDQPDQPLYAEIPAANANTNAPLAVAADYYDTPVIRVDSPNNTPASASSHYDHDYSDNYAPAAAAAATTTAGASEWDGFDDGEDSEEEI